MSRAILKWLAGEDIEIALIDPGKPWQHGMTEPRNDKLRDECRGTRWFRNGINAKILTEDSQREYHEARSHSSRGQVTPAKFKKRLVSTADPESAIF